MSDEFILVTKSKSSKKSRKFKDSKLNNIQLSSVFSLEKTINQLSNYRIQELENSEFLEKVLTQLEEVFKEKKIKEIICLGIGRISEDIISKYQFIFILIVKEKLQIASAKFYDPIFDENDRKILNYFNCEILTENKEGNYTVDEPTIFYLPHCPKQITNNLLFSNWNTEGLTNLYLICNSFKSIIESTPERFLRPNAHYILEINNYIKELPIHNCFKFNDIFNDLSIHIIPSTHLPEETSKFWKDRNEPVYSAEEIEFIKNGNSNQNLTRNSQ